MSVFAHMGMCVEDVGDGFPVDIPVFLGVDSDIGTNNLTTPTITGIGQAIVIGILCNTRQNAAPLTSQWRTPDVYALGSTGFDAHGGSGGISSVVQTFGTRSQLEYRQDFLSFYGDADEYACNTNANDHSNSVAFYRCPAGWKIKQVASGVNSSVNISATFANPVSSGSRIVVAVACLSANSVATPPSGATLDDTTSNASNRTSRLTAYRITDGTMVGQTNRTVVLSSATGGGAMIMLEVAYDDTAWVYALPTAILAASGLIGYYPMNHTLDNTERDCALGTLTDLTGLNGTWTNYSVTGNDGRKYYNHASGSGGGAIGDNTELTPNGNGGLTIGFVVRIDSLATVNTIISKNTANTTDFAKEWEISVDTNGALFARTMQNSNTIQTARQRITANSTIAVNTWYFVVVRFGNGAADFPTIRINGSNHTGTTSGTTNANGNTSAGVGVGVRGASGTTQALRGALGHLFFLGSNVADADVQTLETAADADGWY